MDKIRIACLSDTHTRHERVEVPDADILVHAGDFCSSGHISEAARFFKWFNELPHKHKVVIPGNHDWCCELIPFAIEGLVGEGVHYLIDEGCEIEGLKFWGSPWQPRFYDWAFNLDRGEPLRQRWAMIPDDTDILVTHGPPYKILDFVPGDEFVGCKDLRDRVDELRLKMHIFGHIHYSYGHNARDGTIYVNASTCSEEYEPIQPVQVFELELG